MRSNRRLRVVHCALAALALLGCDRVTREVAREVVTATAPEVETPRLEAVSETEATEYGAALVAAVEAGDLQVIDQLIDFSILGRRALAGFKLPERQVGTMLAGVGKGARTNGLIKELSTIAASGTRLRVLGTRQDDQGRWLTLRFLPAAGGVAHHNCLLSKRPDGTVVTADIHVLTSGELVSTSLRRFLIGALAQDKSFVERITEQENVLLKHLDDIQGAREDQLAGRFKEAADRLEKLPPQVRNQKFALLMRIAATASAEDDPRYQRTLEDFLEHHGKDPAAAVAAIDHYILRKEFDQALTALDTVERGIVPDPFFRVIRANVLLEAGRAREAMFTARDAIQSEPDLVDAHWSLVAASLSAKDFDTTARALLQMRESFGLEFELERVPEYAEFLRSRQYAGVQQALAAPRP